MNSTTNGSFIVEEAASADSSDKGPAATATITVNVATLHAPDVTNATTTQNTQTNSGLAITPNTADTSAVSYFRITGITGGTLFQNDGTTPISNNSFITVAQGGAGLKFTPTTGSLTSGHFTVQESTNNNTTGLGGTTTTATITVNVPTLHAPNVTNAATIENTQTSSGLVITPNAADASVVTNYQITNITGGTLYFNNGFTQISNGSFITLAQGAAGLKFTPTTNSLTSGSFTVQESINSTVAGLGGSTTTATITVNPPTLHNPNVSNATTTENTQTTSGLVITSNSADISVVTNYRITDISGGTLFQQDGSTQIADGSFISAAQGAAGLKFTPTTGSLTSGSFTVQESTTSDATGLGGSTATATITVNAPTLHTPIVSNATTVENTQTTSGLTITPNASDTAVVNSFQITNITGGTLYLHDGTTQIANGNIITLRKVPPV